MHMALLCLPLHPLLKKILKVYNLKTKQNINLFEKSCFFQYKTV